MKRKVKKYILPVLFGIFFVITIWSFFRDDPPATRLIYYVFDALLGTMLYERYRKNQLHVFIMYVVFFGLITLRSFSIGGFTFLFVLMIDMPVAVLAYRAYGEIY